MRLNPSRRGFERNSATDSEGIAVETLKVAFYSDKDFFCDNERMSRWCEGLIVSRIASAGRFRFLLISCLTSASYLSRKKFEKSFRAVDNEVRRARRPEDSGPMESERELQDGYVCFRPQRPTSSPRIL